MLFSFFIFYYLIVFVLRSFLLWKQTGINPLTFGQTDDAHGYNGKMFKIVSAIELIVVSIYTFLPQWSHYLLPFWYLDHAYLSTIGWALLLFSLIWVAIAQRHMASSWRIGIDEAHDTMLVTTGLFSLSRNPVFLGIMIANIGLFLIIPNAITLLIVCLANLTINTQIRLEETYLQKTFGQTYLTYQQRVRHWI